MMQWLLFGTMALLLLGGVYFAWYSWRAATQMTPEEEEYDDRVASLNDRQANRLTDEQLTHPISDQDAWEVMVWRGRRQRRGARGRRARQQRRR